MKERKGGAVGRAVGEGLLQGSHAEKPKAPSQREMPSALHTSPSNLLESNQHHARKQILPFWQMRKLRPTKPVVLQ